MSPPLVIAFGLAGDASKDLAKEPVQVLANGTQIYLKDIWPTHEEFKIILKKLLDANDFEARF
jgi:aconitate hydratase